MYSKVEYSNYDIRFFDKTTGFSSYFAWLFTNSSDHTRNGRLERNLKYVLCAMHKFYLMREKMSSFYPHPPLPLAIVNELLDDAKPDVLAKVDVYKLTRVRIPKSAYGLEILYSRRTTSDSGSSIPGF